MAKPEEQDYSIDLPVIGEKKLGTWIHSCHPPINTFVPTWVLSAGIDVEISLDKLKDVAGSLGKLFGDKELTNFINNAKALAPSGKFGLKTAWQVEPYQTPCPGYRTYLALVGFSLKFVLIGNIEGTYGIVKGKAYAYLSVEVVGDHKACDCPEAPKDAETPPSEGTDGTDQLLAGGPPTPWVSMPGEVDRGCAPEPQDNQAICGADSTTTSGDAVGKAIVTRIDRQTGEKTVVGQLPVY